MGCGTKIKKKKDKIQEINGELTKEFWDFVKNKKHPNITICKTQNIFKVPFPQARMLPLFYYENRINKVEAFWEKKIFELLLKEIETCHEKMRIEIVTISLSSFVVDFGVEPIPYNLKRGFILKYKRIKI